MNRPRLIDPVSLEVVRGRTQTISDEMLNGLVRSSFSAVIKENADASTAIFDARGQCIVQSGIPILLGTLFAAVNEVLADFPVAKMVAGDIYATNDPYRGGTHIPDLILFSPIFVKDRVVALSVTIAHHRDVGGRVPGSAPVDSTEIFQEGVRIPPIRLFEAGRPNDAILTVMRANSRLPDMISGDVDAQIGACLIGERRIREMVEEFGVDETLDMFDELLDRSERLTRGRLSALPPGRYEFEDYLDNDGVDLDRMIPIKVAVTIGDGEVVVDFTGSSPQVRGPVNAPSSVSLAAAFFVVRCVTDSSISSNSGCLRPIKVITPPGSVVNPQFPAPVNARSIMFCLLVDAIFGAFAKAAPGKVPACGYDFPLVHFGGLDRHKKPFVFSEIGTGGYGARSHRDGIDVYRSKNGNALSMPTETTEMDFPVRISTVCIRKDSGGAGRFRGGLGYTKIYQALTDGVTVSMRGDRHRTGPWGLDDGKPGEPSLTEVIRRDGTRFNIPSKQVFRMNTGDSLVIHSAGGGGYGSPLERPVTAVVADVLDHKISRESAATKYGVIIDEGNHVVNEADSSRDRARCAQEMSAEGKR
ncbi:MAG: hydantoinase B/oxoprolinase family protein [Alphaproteobacteria bacterium]|nr:hydantoinase B/oxoprolinase family protein [Alphaproteobacteria bacterium]